MGSKKELIGRIEIKNEFDGTEEEKSAFNSAINDPEYINADSFRSQIGTICKYVRTETINVSFERIGKVFDETGHCVMIQYNKFNRGPTLDGRPAKLNDGQIALVKNYIDGFITENGHLKFPTYNDVADFISEKLNKYLIPDTLRHIIRNNFSNDFKTVTGKAMEFNRLNVELSDIEKNLYDLNEKIRGVPTRFLFNLDEIGCEEFADSQDIKVIVPKKYRGNCAPYGINRRKRNSVLVCISADGFDCIPQITIRRSTIENEIYKYIPKEKVQIVNTKKGFITTKSFLLWLNSIFLPFLRNERMRTGYQGQSVLILDGYLPHIKAFESIDLQGEKLTLHFLVPHSSHLLQPLDLCIFSVMKGAQIRFRWFKNVSEQTQELVKIHQSLYKAATPTNCRSSFRAAGIMTKYYQNRHQVFELTYVDVNELDQIPYYQISHIC